VWTAREREVAAYLLERTIPRANEQASSRGARGDRGPAGRCSRRPEGWALLAYVACIRETRSVDTNISYTIVYHL
jgi:hypothetical protein